MKTLNSARQNRSPPWTPIRQVSGFSASAHPVRLGASWAYIQLNKERKKKEEEEECVRAAGRPYGSTEAVGVIPGDPLGCRQAKGREIQR
eukprot:5307434-Prymnesium_polylepis.1